MVGRPVPVTEGKKMASRMVKLVVMSAMTSPRAIEASSSEPGMFPWVLYLLKMFSEEDSVPQLQSATCDPSLTG